MLRVRAATNRIPRSILRRGLRPPASEPLLLPFLYPPCGYNTQWPRYSSFSSSSGEGLPRKEAAQADRSYSTATTVSTDPLLDEDIRLLGYKPPAYNGFTQQPAPVLEDMKWRLGLDASKVVIYDPPDAEEVQVPGKRNLQRIASTGIPVPKREVLATFDACIGVGRLERAQLMLQQITQSLDKDSTILIGAHNTFLQALLNKALSDSSQREEGLRVFFVWYENKMKREFTLVGDATTVALLLKASLAMTNSLYATRYVKQYVNAWKQAGGDIGQVLELSVLSDEEVVNIAKICLLKIDELHEKQRILFQEDEPLGTPPPITKVPEVRPGLVGGLGLETIKQSIRSLVDPDAIPTPHIFGKDDIAFQIERQKLLEEDVYESAQTRWKKDHEAMLARGVASMPESLNDMLWAWHQSMLPLLREELVRVAQAEENPQMQSAGERCLYGPFLRLVRPEKMAAVAVLEMVRVHQTMGTAEGVKSSSAVMAVGKALEAEYMAQEISKKNNREAFSKHELAELFNNPHLFRLRVKQARKRQADNPHMTLDMLPDWPTTITAKIGAVLISMLIHCAKIEVTARNPQTSQLVTEFHDAFIHTYEYIRGRKLGVIKLHQEIARQLGSQPLRRGVVGRLLPMVVPPRPWLAWDEGAYYYSRTRVVRTKNSKEQEIYVRAASKRGDLDQVFQGLDVLGQTAWRINDKVFNIVLHAWNSGEKFAEIPPANPDINLPPEPPPSTDPKKRTEWLIQVRNMKTEERNCHSQRADINFKVEIARAFLYERFYFPHNVDFRGRAYPIPPNLNHVGNDLSRGLLMFDEAKEIGESGLRWLKIHLANLAGHDKASFADRVKFVDDHLDDIFDSAKKPLEGRRWWLKTEDPWQCLAACFALHEALSLPDPATYKCHLPVAQDGTCNGLQHYAALGGDTIGAKQVNLEPSDKPQDVYTGVAELVKAAVDIDVENGNEVAKMVQNFVTRKVVKQTVMTNVYGVTFMGARVQIENQLREISEIPRERSTTCAYYLTSKVFHAIKRMFHGATHIQNWLAASARRISRSIGPSQFKTLLRSHGGRSQIEFMTAVIFTTPLNLPVVQPYRKDKVQMINTNLQKIYISDPTIINQVNARKQVTAFPPNFIHSLDATHMLLSAMKSAEHGLTFASVHDSFWTHPGDVDTLNRILRDAFISLHSHNLMERLLVEFETRYKGHRCFAVINQQTACAKAIKKARKAYAADVLKKGTMGTIDDLEWELERDRLLASKDPEERKRGEEMVTPSVIVARAGGIEKIGIEEEVEAELGAIEDDKKKANAPELDIEKQDIVAADVAEDPSEGSDLAEMSVHNDVDAVEDEMDDEDAVEDEMHAEAEESGETEDIEESGEMEGAAEAAGTTAFGMHSTYHNPILKASKAKKVQIKTIGVWMPLEFPPLPEKGEFDVSSLKDSQYFFS